MSRSIRARSSAVTSGRTPNHFSKPGTAWCSSMPRPSTAAQARARAPRPAAAFRAARRRCRRRRSLASRRRDIHVERLAAFHAERGCIDQQGRVARPVGAIAPVVGLHLGAEVGRHGVGAGARAVEEAHLARRRAPAGRRRCRARRRRPRERRRSRRRVCRPGCAASRLFMNPALSVLSATSRPPSNHSVLAAPAARAAGRVSDGRGEGRLLVGQRDIAAGEALLAQRAQEIGDVARLDGMAHVAAVDAIALQPIAVDQRRARMRDGPADDAGAYHVVDHSARPELGQQRHERQADDGEVVALDALEQLDAEAFDLVGADDAGIARAGLRPGSGREMHRAEGAHGEHGLADVGPDGPSRPRASATAETRRCVLPRRRSSWARAAARSPGLSSNSSPRARIWSAPMTIASGCLALTASALARASASRDSAAGWLAARCASRVSRRFIHVGRNDTERDAGRFQHLAPVGTGRGQNAAARPASAIARFLLLGRRWRPPRRSCRRRMMVAAVSSTERRVTSMTGQPWRAHRRREYWISSVIWVRST